MHVIACEQAQPALNPFVVLCRVTSHSSALQVEETEPLVAGEQQKKEGSQNALLRCPSSWWLALAVSSMPAGECALQWWFVMAAHSSYSIVSSQT